MIEDAIIIDDSNYLSDATDTVFNIADRLLTGKKGFAFTMGIRSAGLAKNNVEFSRFFSDNSGVINAYFEHVDTRALVNVLGADKVKSDLKKALWNPWTALFTGLAAGFLISRLKK